MPKITQSLGKAGLYRRTLAPSSVRQKTIQRISRIPEGNRTSDHWWELGDAIALEILSNVDGAAKRQRSPE